MTNRSRLASRLDPAAKAAELPAVAEAHARRGARGRFVAGHPGGPGNPFVRRQAELWRAIHAAQDDEQSAALARMIFDQACAGDLAALKVLGDVIGL